MMMMLIDDEGDDGKNIFVIIKKKLNGRDIPDLKLIKLLIIIKKLIIIDNEFKATDRHQ